MLSAMKILFSLKDKEFMDELYREHFAMLHKLARSILGEDDASEEIVTNAMLSLFSMVPFLCSLEERERVAYLRKTVRNAAYKYYKARKLKNVTELPLDDDLLFSLPSAENDPAEQLLQDEDFEMVRESIKRLPKQDRQILYLKYAADLTALEIAQLTGAPSAAAVRERLFRARRRVLSQLEERGRANGREAEYPGTLGTV